MKASSQFVKFQIISGMVDIAKRRIYIGVIPDPLNENWSSF